MIDGLEPSHDIAFIGNTIAPESFPDYQTQKLVFTCPALLALLLAWWRDGYKRSSHQNNIIFPHSTTENWYFKFIYSYIALVQVNLSLISWMYESRAQQSKYFPGNSLNLRLKPLNLFFSLTLYFGKCQIYRKLKNM